MSRIRPTRVLTAAGLTLLTLGLAVGWTDPVWAQAAGLDVWNVGRLESKLREQTAEYDRLQVRHTAIMQQFVNNDQIVRDVCDGYRPLDAGAKLLLSSNLDMPGYDAVLEMNYRGPSQEAKAAQNLIDRVRWHPTLGADIKARELPRLRAAYTAIYGGN